MPYCALAFGRGGAVVRILLSGLYWATMGGAVVRVLLNGLRTILGGVSAVVRILLSGLRTILGATMGGAVVRGECGSRFLATTTATGQHTL